MAVTTVNGSGQAAKASFLYRPEVRQVIYQIILIVLLGIAVWEIVNNVADNLRRQNIASGFGFWDRTSGFDISQTLIAYSNTSTYGQAFWVGLTNTLLVAVLGIAFATILGFVIGIARLSSNWVVAKLATVYVEVIRNLPLLLQLMFWYFAVLKNLPGPRQSLALPAGASLNVRGLYLPAPVPQDGFGAVMLALLIGIVGSIAVSMWARRRQMATGQQFPVLWTSLALIFGLPLLAYLLTGMPLTFDYPELKGFNFQGGMVVQPEFMALLLGLSIYTASFIAEIVRAGIMGVSKGQKEAARAIGLTNGQMLRLVVIPQAARIIIPPLTSQYLNLTKNSSLAVAIGYPDFVSVFTGTVLNQT
jgi:general L-amino acid transport system permease protein